MLAILLYFCFCNHLSEYVFRGQSACIRVMKVEELGGSEKQIPLQSPRFAVHRSGDWTMDLVFGMSVVVPSEQTCTVQLGLQLNCLWPL